MQKNKKKSRILQQVLIDKIGYGGIGIGRLADGKKVLVHGGVLPGALIDVIVTKSKKDFFEGRVFFVHSLPEEFAQIQPPCPHYFGFGSKDATTENEHTIGCGGCKRQQVDYKKQLQLKQDIFLDSIRGIKEQLESAEIRDILPSPEHRGYRNKIEYSFGDYKRGEVHNQRALGFHKQGHFSQIIDIDECLLVSQTSKKIFAYLKTLCINSGLPTYNQFAHVGFFRHLMVREGKNTEQFLVNLSISDNTLTDQQRKQRQALQDIFHQDEFLKKHITSFVLSVNNGLGDSIFNAETKQTLLRGEDYFYEKLQFETADVTYRVSTNSFFQTNTLGAQVLFSTAIQLLGNIDGPLIDLYCGTGTIGIACNKLGIGDSLYGIEIVPDAIVDAEYNAKINGIENAYFLAGKAETLLQTDEQFRQACETTQCIIVDPPRDGLHKNVVSFLVEQRKHHPFKLLYISCNPVTLARDITLLSEEFTAKIIQPVDMFPHTHHIETICVLS